MRFRFPLVGFAAFLPAAAALSLAHSAASAQSVEPPPAAENLPNAPDKLPKPPKGFRFRTPAEHVGRRVHP